MNVTTMSADWLDNCIKHITRQRLALPLPTLRPDTAQGCFKLFQSSPLAPLDSSPNELRDDAEFSRYKGLAFASMFLGRDETQRYAKQLCFFLLRVHARLEFSLGCQAEKGFLL